MAWQIIQSVFARRKKASKSSICSLFFSTISAQGNDLPAPPPVQSKKKTKNIDLNAEAVTNVRAASRPEPHSTSPLPPRATSVGSIKERGIRIHTSTTPETPSARVKPSNREPTGATRSSKMIKKKSVRVRNPAKTRQFESVEGPSSETISTDGQNHSPEGTMPRKNKHKMLMPRIGTKPTQNKMSVKQKASATTSSKKSKPLFLCRLIMLIVSDDTDLRTPPWMHSTPKPVFENGVPIYPQNLKQ